MVAGRLGSRCSSLGQQRRVNQIAPGGVPRPLTRSNPGPAEPTELLPEVTS